MYIVCRQQTMKQSPVLRIDLASPDPAYRQIAAGIRTMLVAGAFAPGDQLPTIRQLAIDLAVHPNTVAEAYRMLAEEGWVELRRRRGVTVLERQAPAAGADITGSFDRRIGGLVAEALAAGVPSRNLATRLSRIVRQLDARKKS